MLGNGIVGGSPFLYIPANAVQCCVAGLWFRYHKLGPRLRSRRDWLGLIFVGCILGNALGGTVGVTESYIRTLGMEEPGLGLGSWLGKLLTWFGGNTLPCLFLAPALLKAASPIIVRGPLFCQSFWGGTSVAYRRGTRLHFADLPMVGKLMVLAVAAGLLPLLLVAAWSIWGSVRAADHVAIEINRQAAHEIRNETERHELMLRLWAAELDRPELNDEGRERLLEQ